MFYVSFSGLFKVKIYKIYLVMKLSVSGLSYLPLVRLGCCRALTCIFCLRFVAEQYHQLGVIILKSFCSFKGI